MKKNSTKTKQKAKSRPRKPKTKKVVVAPVVALTPSEPVAHPEPVDPADINDIFEMPNEELPPEPFYPHWTDSFNMQVLASALNILDRMGYNVTIEPKPEPAAVSQPPVGLSTGSVPTSPEKKWTNARKTMYTGDGGHTSFGVPAAFSFDHVEETGFVKSDAGKTRFSLVPPEARLEVAKVFTHGAKKYPAHNYRKGTEWSRYVDALTRHFTDFELGQNVDEESGLLTLAHVAADAMILLTLQKLKKGRDDRVSNL